MIKVQRYRVMLWGGSRDCVAVPISVLFVATATKFRLILIATFRTFLKTTTMSPVLIKKRLPGYFHATSIAKYFDKLQCQSMSKDTADAL
jgi:hypothetical protein